MSEPENVSVWIRYRTLHSAGPGEWQWQEVIIPAHERRKHKYIQEEVIPDLNETHNTYSEHWRGIEWEMPPVPRHIVEAYMRRIQWRIKNDRADVKRYKELLPTLKQVDLKQPTECSQWPRCGCLKQMKHKDCRRRIRP